MIKGAKVECLGTLRRSSRGYWSIEISEFLVMRIEDAAPRIGAVVTGVDVRSLTEPDWKVLYQTWLERHVLIVRGQTLSKSDFLAYSRRFGRLKPHRVKSTRDFEYPEVTLMGITTGNSTTDKLVLDRGQGWHTDGPWDRSE